MAAAVPPVLPQVPAQEEQCIENPYHGNFNPGTKAGQVFFEKETKDLPTGKRLVATKKDSHAMYRFLEGKSLALGKVIK